jgi:hypothetical protein
MGAPASRGSRHCHACRPCRHHPAQPIPTKTATIKAETLKAETLKTAALKADLALTGLERPITATLVFRAAVTIRKALIAAFLAVLFLLALPPSAVADGELARAREARTAFFEGSLPKDRANWQKLVAQFEAAAKVQPKSHYRTLANLEAAGISLQAYYRFHTKDDARQAARLARAILKDCPRCEAAPASVIVLGRALVADGKLDDAYRELMKVELSYPGTPEVEEARFLMSTLRAGGSPPPYPTTQPTVIVGQAAAPANLAPSSARSRSL